MNSRLKSAPAFPIAPETRFVVPLVRSVHVGGDDEPAAGAADPLQFLQRPVRLVQQMDDVRGHDRVKAFVRVIQMENVSLRKLHIAEFGALFLCRRSIAAEKSVAVRRLQRGAITAVSSPVPQAHSSTSSAGEISSPTAAHSAGSLFG